MITVIIVIILQMVKALFRLELDCLDLMLKSVDSPGGVNDLGLSEMVLIPTRYCEQSKIKSESLAGKGF